MPPGLGEPIFDRLDADIAHALMSINAVKGVEIGAGFGCIEQKGTEHRDEHDPGGFPVQPRGRHPGRHLHRPGHRRPHRAQTDLQHPPAGRTIGDRWGQPAEVVTTGRHDPCVGIRATPIAEAMLALVLMDHWLRQRGQNADVTPAAPPIPARTGA